MLLKGASMYKVVCLNDGKEYMLKCNDGKSAIKGMKHFLDLGEKDSNSEIIEHDGKYVLYHGDKVYACLM